MSGYAVKGPSAVSIADGSNIDAFSRLRVSATQAIFDSRFEYKTGESNWDTQTSGASSGITHLPLESSVRLTVGTGATDSCYRQTVRYFRYQPGKSQLIFLTGVLGAAVANVRKRVGYFDALNGIFLEQNGTTDLAIVRRTNVTGSVVPNRVVQASWNLDTLDGSGSTANPSGYSLDVTKGYILVIDLQWLGYGRIRVGFDIGGQIVHVHEFLNANVLTTVYITTATLPVRYEIANTAGSAGASMTQTCTSVNSEGGVEEVSGFEFGASNGTTTIGVTSRRAILSIRPQATFNSIVNRIVYTLLDYGVICATNNAFMELVYNPTYTTAGGALTWAAPDAYSSMERSVHGDANAGAFTAGYSIGHFYVTSGSGATRIAFSGGIRSSYPLALDSTGANPRALALVATSMSGTTNIAGSFNWRELR